MSQETIAAYYQGDHDRLDKIFQGYKSARKVDIAKAQSLFSEFKAGLERHIAWEEKILFPAFEAKTGMRETGPTTVMRMEHGQIKEALGRITDELQKETPEPEVVEASLVSILSNHNHKEENILYPGIDQMLGADERTEIFRKMEV